MTTTYLTVVETAKLIRKALKGAFPEQKFSVTSSKYANGASARVAWTDGPFEADVKPVTDRFEGATFDGMIDLKSYKDPVLYEGETVSMGADYVFTDRVLSRGYLVDLTTAAEAVLAANPEWPQEKAVATPFGVVGHVWDVSGVARYLSRYLSPRQAEQVATFESDGTRYRALRLLAQGIAI